MMKVEIFAIFAMLSLSALAKDPPLMGDSFQIAFDQAFLQNETHFRVNGQMFYDAIKQRSRVDRTNGRYDIFCGTVLPNVTTSCSHIVVGGKRYINFPLKNQCCFCCDSAHGCGILKKNWLEGADYLGTEKLIDTFYDKWSKDGDIGSNYVYVTTDDNHIPRRLDEGKGQHVTDYLVHTFLNKTFSDQVFAIPANCTQSCPLQSFCGKFRDGPTKLTYH